MRVKLSCRLFLRLWSVLRILRLFLRLFPGPAFLFLSKLWISRRHRRGRRRWCRLSLVSCWKGGPGCGVPPGELHF